MKNKNVIFFVFVVVFLFSACAYEFSAEPSDTRQTNIELDQFGLPHDMSPGNTISVLGDSMKNSDEKVKRTSANFADSNGDPFTITATQPEIDYYTNHSELVDVFSKLHDQQYLQGLFEKTYGSNGNRKVHIPNPRIQVFARHQNGDIEMLFVYPTWMFKGKGGQKNMKTLGVMFAKTKWHEELKIQDVFVLSAK